MKKRIGILPFLLIFIFLFTFNSIAETQNNFSKPIAQNKLYAEELSKIEEWIEKNIRDGKIPGVSVVIVKGDKIIYNKGFGYANIDKQIPVTSKTLFELGSNSKAFTALGILKLEKEGRIKLSDSVKKYIPWFKMKYVGEHLGEKYDGYVDITLQQLLHHTSGIPFKSIGDIPIDEAEDALEKTVRTQVGKKLDFYPGTKYLYATINYDILGLVIQNVTGESYEHYMENNILKPMGLNSTYLFKNNNVINEMAVGYKMNFLKQRAYNAPIYRGNTPAGYIITNSEDLAKWIKIQIGTYYIDKSFDGLIEKSHLPDRTVSPDYDGSSYSYGWSVYQDGTGMLSHSGSNPNFSSNIAFKPQEQIGVGVLANTNSNYTSAISQGILRILQNEKPKKDREDPLIATEDLAITIDRFSTALILICIPVISIIFWQIVIALIDIFRGKRKYSYTINKFILSGLAVLLFLVAFWYSLYNIPDVMFNELSWDFIRVWAPSTLQIAGELLFTAVSSFLIYYMLISLFPSENENPLFVISVLSISSGFGNALIIFIINEALNRVNEKFETGLFLFFIIGIVIYVFGQLLVRMKLLTYTNEIVYKKRIQFINQILDTSYEKFEQLSDGKIHAGLNNDTEIISNLSNTVITGATGCVTLICCFVYLGIINLYGVLISILIIILAAGLYYVVGRYANKQWEETRDIQNIFFKFINSMIGGFKELKIHKTKQNEFKKDMQSSCKEYRDKRIKGDLSFANAFIIGELVFTLVIGAVAFAFHLIFKDIKISSLRNYVFIFLYMTGPVNGVLESIPQILKIRISYKRLNELSDELSVIKTTKDESATASIEHKDTMELVLRDVEYRYSNNEGEEFSIGPISCNFKSGEITFITGGNGSGKSTLAKLITGLYIPSSGEIYLNDYKMKSEDISEYFSTILSDFYLFEKLYGIDYENKQDKIQEYLDILRIKNKIQINNGAFSTIKLSTGQRKRLALMVSYLEDRPIYLFDEWAADQDPEFRSFFYSILLPELKRNGKCIIAITHDDKYFNLADKVIKMEMGKIIASQ